MEALQEKFADAAGPSGSKKKTVSSSPEKETTSMDPSEVGAGVQERKMSAIDIEEAVARFIKLSGGERIVNCDWIYPESLSISDEEGQGSKWRAILDDPWDKIPPEWAEQVVYSTDQRSDDREVPHDKLTPPPSPAGGGNWNDYWRPPEKLESEK